MESIRSLSSFLRNQFATSERLINDAPGISLFKILVHTGVTILVASIGFFSISVLLISPTSEYVPLGRLGQVLMGAVGSFISLKLYKLLKLSHSTLLRTGKETLVDQPSQERIGGWRRAGYALLSVIGLIGAPIIGAFAWSYVEGVSLGAEGPVANFLQEITLPLVISLIIFELGLIVLFVGFGMILWSSTRPFRATILALYRLSKFKAYSKIVNVSASQFSWLQSIEQDEICEACYETSFNIREEQTVEGNVYLVCSNCSTPYRTVETLGEDTGTDEIDKLAEKKR